MYSEIFDIYYGLEWKMWIKLYIIMICDWNCKGISIK